MFCCCFCFCCFCFCCCFCFVVVSVFVVSTAVVVDVLFFVAAVFSLCCAVLCYRRLIFKLSKMFLTPTHLPTHPPSHPPTFPPSSIFLLPAFHFSTTAFPPPHPSPLPVLISQLPPPPLCSYRVVNEYKCRNDDELTLTRGDVIKVVEKCRDGWWVGVSMETGNMGIFPGNHVALI